MHQRSSNEGAFARPERVGGPRVPYQEDPTVALFWLGHRLLAARACVSCQTARDWFDDAKAISPDDAAKLAIAFSELGAERLYGALP